MLLGDGGRGREHRGAFQSLTDLGGPSGLRHCRKKKGLGRPSEIKSAHKAQHSLSTL